MCGDRLVVAGQQERRRRDGIVEHVDEEGGGGLESFQAVCFVEVKSRRSRKALAQYHKTRDRMGLPTERFSYVLLSFFGAAAMS